MSRAVDVILRRLDRLPNGHMEEDTIVVRIRPKIGGVPFVRLKPPNEARTLMSKRVEFIQPVHEAGHDGIVEWRLEPSHVDLGYVIFAHRLLARRFEFRVSPVQVPIVLFLIGGPVASRASSHLKIAFRTPFMVRFAALRA
jgi:hypothetical protein